MSLSICSQLRKASPSTVSLRHCSTSRINSCYLALLLVISRLHGECKVSYGQLHEELPQLKKLNPVHLPTTSISLKGTSNPAVRVPMVPHYVQCPRIEAFQPRLRRTTLTLLQLESMWREPHFVCGDLQIFGVKLHLMHYSTTPMRCPSMRCTSPRMGRGLRALLIPPSLKPLPASPGFGSAITMASKGAYGSWN
jgi:hypothetical protein